MRKTEVKVRIANPQNQTNSLTESLQTFHTEFILELLWSGEYTSQQIAEVVLKMQKDIMLYGKEACRKTA